jgi:diguanylate cyclase (GGDEF)-like protein/PAS domain S-box-containing protein
MELTADGMFQYVSPRASAVLGYEPDVLLGRSVLDLVHPDDRNELAAVLAQAWRIGVEESAQYRFRRADETHIWVRSFISAIPSGIPGGLMALAFTVRDVDAAVVAEQTRQTEEQQLRDMAFIDSLTGMRNRRYLDSKVEELLGSTAFVTSSRAVAVLFADIDYFKNFNDEYGHQVGDECLKTVGQCIATTLRKHDLVARYGGEEFVIVLENCEQTEAAATAELTRAAVESLGLGHRGSPLGVVTLSIGVAQGEMRRPSDAAELFELADSALYMAKRMGRNRVGRVQDAIAAGESASSSAVTLGARRHL